MADLDFAGLNHQLLFQAENLLSSWLPGGKRKGKEFCAGSTSGESGESLKINLKTGKWADFATGQKGGDLISLCAEIRGCAQGAAFAELNSTLGDIVPRETKKVEKVADTKQESEFTAPPEKESSPDIVKTFKNPTSFWLYKDSEGRALFYVCRYDSVDGKKTFLPWSWSKLQKKWIQKGWPAPRPLFGLDLLSKNPELPVLLVEGEKACQAAQNLFLKKYVVVTWPNGASAASKSDWSPLFGRKILIWPDADKPGIKASREIAKILAPKCPEIKLISVSEDGGGADAFDWIQENGTDWKRFVAWVKPLAAVYNLKFHKEAEKDAIKVDMDELVQVAKSKKAPKESLNPETGYLKPLGFKDGTYFYTSSDNLQISQIQNHTEIELLKLMPEAYWLQKYPKEGAPKKIDWLKARSDLTEECRRVGIFTKKDVRGHGVWMDEGKVVLHLGDRLYYDGADHHVHSLMKKHVYEFDEALPPIHEKPLSDEEMVPFRQLLESFNYTNNQQGYFLGGWIALSGICGALKWRPHLWLTGEPGSGKSTIKEMIDSYLFHAFKRLSAIGASTEAGLRQAIKAHSIPIIFDEFEQENRASSERLQSCLELMRQASSENASSIFKGSADGDSISYYARFSALVCSVKPRLVTEADRSRFTYVQLQRDQQSNEQWLRVQELLKIMTPEYCKRLFARMVELIPVILKNQETFQAAFVTSGQSQRLGQQYGSLLAGFTALLREDEITFEEAMQFVSQINLEDEDTLDGGRDQEEALEYLLNKRFTTKEHDRTVAQWIQNSKEEELNLLGIKKNNQGVLLHRNNPQIGMLFEGSKWGNSWFMVLKRIKGVDIKRFRLPSGRAYRGLFIPNKFVGIAA